MKIKKLFKPTYAFAILAVLILSASVYAFAAANTVPATDAGAGSGVISGYTVSNVAYTLDATTPTELDAVTFDITGTDSAADPGTVKVQLVATGGTWYDCTIGTSPNWSCTVTDTLLVENMDQLSVVATN